MAQIRSDYINAVKYSLSMKSRVQITVKSHHNRHERNTIARFFKIKHPDLPVNDRHYRKPGFLARNDWKHYSGFHWSINIGRE